MIVRYERWGAWVKLEETAALVALDRDGARAAGLDGGPLWSEALASATTPADAGATAPIEVHLAVTAKCGAGCEGCYLDARPDGHAPATAELLARLDAIARGGAFTVAFGGGEPLTRSDLDVLAERARALGLTPVLTTSGLGLTETRIRSLHAFAQVNVSYDGPDATYTAVRGYEGANAAEAAILRLSQAKLRVGVNVVLTAQSFPRLRETVRRARELGASEAQLLRYKPAGRAKSLDYFARRLTAAQTSELGTTMRAMADEHCGNGGADAFHLRIDCAMLPLLSDDPAMDPARLARMGVLGCEAAALLGAVRVDGEHAPCSFAAHAGPEALATWRAYAERPAEPCASCDLRAVCKGGCKVVATFVDGVHGPDPECPRVRRFRETRKSG